MYCKKCGNQLSATAVFCGSCGNPTNKGNATPPVCRTGRQKKSPVKLIIAGISAAAIIATVAVVMVFFPFWEDTATPVVLAEEPLLLAEVEENGESGESENIEETAALPNLANPEDTEETEEEPAPPPIADTEDILPFTTGTFLGIGTDGWNNDIHVEVVFSDNAITAVEVVFSEDTPSFADPAFAALIPAVLAAQSADVDNFAGATVTSGAFLAAVQHAIEQSVAGVVDVPPAAPPTTGGLSPSVIQALRAAIAEYSDIISALTENHWTFFDSPFYRLYHIYDIFDNNVPVLVIEYYGMMGPENSRLLRYANGSYITVDNFDHSLNFFKDQHDGLILAVAHSPGDTARLEYFFMDENFNLTPLATILGIHAGADFTFDAINHQTGETTTIQNPPWESVDRYFFSYEQIFGMPDLILTPIPHMAGVLD
ncbi:MAG: FMN-binding protein [Defluviitaleaceae bacterium]|nr:FMN-binding protein [Defluviitaleaceae bacterium]